jgi:hypothetical protein
VRARRPLRYMRVISLLVFLLLANRGVTLRKSEGVKGVLKDLATRRRRWVVPRYFMATGVVIVMKMTIPTACVVSQHPRR